MPVGLPNPADLGSLWSSNPGAFQQGQQLIGLGVRDANQAHDAALQEQMFKAQLHHTRLMRLA
jgi:hypothetical protein